MEFPENLKYTKDHEWALIDGNKATIGITDHAQSSLGDIVFVDLPEVGKEVSPGDTFGVVESIKAVSDLYSPLKGKVIEVNSKLGDEPASLNQSPYDQGWIVKIEFEGDASGLMDSTAYKAHVEASA